ncbi:DNA repair protein rad2 [Friedmanniomyces endolithicus]|nr:DNA repair protein rad2 [Friedmanniomyces endolithicus]KAK0267666.1 DNA repair protein rad2 [Friedmanniomyces endolithicus]KAK0970804.1 DNA repair protein rad2 [Friedmanniomyces endolithicus]
MGVTDLWHILQPSARPIKIETLHRKRLAVDASLWIYEFLKAVRDNEGNALRKSRVIGFFRRICKLFFFGIKPVFVFDGGAPALKLQTIYNRKLRWEGRRDDAVRMAGKLLAVQMQRRAEEEEQRRKDEKGRRRDEEENEVPDESLLYVDELQMTHAEWQQNRKFRKKDAYHLPEMQVGMHEMGGPNHPRVMSLEDLQTHARQFESGEDINIARVSERNELTTRLMNINHGYLKYSGGSTRVAGEKAREYVLVKNDGVEGGWALGVITGDEGMKQETAIDLEKPTRMAKNESSEYEDEGF